MTKPRIEWNVNGFRDLRTDPDLVADMDARATWIMEEAESDGGQYKTFGSVSGGRGRYRAGVFTADAVAMRKTAKHYTLLRSLDAGRG